MPTQAVIDRHDIVIGQPADWDAKRHGHCGGLAVRFDKINGVPYMHSAWDFSFTEAHMLLSGAKAVLGISAPVHPVVHIDVDQLPADFEPAYVVRPFTALDSRPMVRVETLHPGGDKLRRLYCEKLIDEGGLSIAVGRAFEAIDQLVRENGWAR